MEAPDDGLLPAPTSFPGSLILPPPEASVEASKTAVGEQYTATLNLRDRRLTGQATSSVSLSQSCCSRSSVSELQSVDSARSSARLTGKTNCRPGLVYFHPANLSYTRACLKISLLKKLISLISSFCVFFFIWIRKNHGRFSISTLNLQKRTLYLRWAEL